MGVNKMYSEYIEHLKETLDEYRFKHSLSVADRAVVLAQKYGADKDKAYLAGLLHDVTKNKSNDEQLQFFEESAIMLSSVEKASPKVWHAISGAAFLENKLNIKDKDILNAVRYHTTGRAGMSLLEKIIYIADFTSADRTYPDVDVLREIVDNSLDEGIIYALKYTIVSLCNKNQLVHPDTLDAYNKLTLDRK